MDLATDDMVRICLRCPCWRDSGCLWNALPGTGGDDDQMTNCPVRQRLADSSLVRSSPVADTPAHLRRKSRIARQAALASTLFWGMVGMLSVLAHDLGLTHLNMGDLAPLILQGWGLLC